MNKFVTFRASFEGFNGTIFVTFHYPPDFPIEMIEKTSRGEATKLHEVVRIGDADDGLWTRS